MMITKRVDLKFAACLLVLTLAASSSRTAEALRGKVVRIADGDTVTVLGEGRMFRIRVAGIDAPERRQPWGTRARQFTATVCFNKNVTVIVRDKDRYGRIVGEVLLPDGQNLGEMLVRNGLAWQYRRYSNSSKLADLENKARQERIGLWSDSSPIPHGSSGNANEAREPWVLAA